VNSYTTRHIGVLLFVTLLSGCAGESPAKETSKSRAATGKLAWSVDLGGEPYRPSTPSTVGALSGTIRLSGPAPTDTTLVTSDHGICGTALPGAVEVGATGGLGNTVVWIANVGSGKSMPADKRVGLSSDECLVQPRLQATVVGAAVNVFNDDKVLHRLVFIRGGTNDTLTVMPFFNDGQVVASEKLTTTTGVVEVRCALHPWTRGYLVVFDHPYFAVTRKDGRFAIDSLPPGTYRTMAWHERMAQPMERTVTVDAGGEGKIDVEVSLTAGPAGPER
jgi:Polysaccharide lyase family 4, domain II